MFYRRWLPLALVLYKFNSALLKTDRRILQQLAVTDSQSAFKIEAAHIKEDYLANKDYGILRRYLKFRLSGQRMLRVGAEIWRNEQTLGFRRPAEIPE
ncbi:MAG TPA: hypothetical protein VGR78_13475 [Verrucomicrobiae bacterium]|nr:hypothetical protein [Verrucomicrobiae bacterium]